MEFKIPAAAVAATERALKLVDWLKELLASSERWSERLDEARQAIEDNRVGTRNRKLSAKAVEKNLSRAARALSGVETFSNVESEIGNLVKEIDGLLADMGDPAQRQVAAHLARVQPPAVAFFAFLPHHWEAEVARNLADCALAAIRRFLNCRSNFDAPTESQPETINLAVDNLDLLLRDLFEILHSRETVDRLESLVAADLIELNAASALPHAEALRTMTGPATTPEASDIGGNDSNLHLLHESILAAAPAIRPIFLVVVDWPADLPEPPSENFCDDGPNGPGIWIYGEGPDPSFKRKYRFRGMINSPLGISEEIRLEQLSRRCAEALSESRSQRPDDRATSDHWLRFVCEVANCHFAEAADSQGHTILRVASLDIDVRLDFSKALKALSDLPDPNPKDPNNPALWSRARRIVNWLKIIKKLTGEDMSDDTFGRRMKKKIYTPHPDRVGKMVRLLLSSLPAGYDDSKQETPHISAHLRTSPEPR